jgi:hypothetical protein
MKTDIILSLYNNIRTVFRLKDIALLLGETNFQSLNKKLNYYVRTGKLQNSRKGVYTKPNYSTEELACSIYTPSYISLEYVLQKAGVIFQYDSRISAVSYLSRTIEVSGREYIFRKIKGEILTNPTGINILDNHVNIATTERAFLDLMYLNKDYYFDNLNPLSKRLVYKLLPLYQSKALTVRVNKLLKK